MSATAVLAEALREEDGILVYTSPAASDPRHSTDWFFDEVGRRDARRILVDLRRATGMEDGLRGSVYRRHREFEGRRVAVLGASQLQEFVVMFLVAATGHRGTRYFTDEQAARKWLAEA